MKISYTLNKRIFPKLMYIFLLFLLPILCIGQTKEKTVTNKQNVKLQYNKTEKRPINKTTLNLSKKSKSTTPSPDTNAKMVKASKPIRVKPSTPQQTQSPAEKNFESCNKRLMHLKVKSDLNATDLKTIQRLELRIEELCKQLELEDCNH